jgi:hypothetical protein
MRQTRRTAGSCSRSARCSGPLPSGPVTIADLIREGKLLEIGCLGCGRHVYVDAAKSDLPAWLAVPEASKRLVCSVCGALNQPTWHPIYARPDARAPGVL